MERASAGKSPAGPAERVHVPLGLVAREWTRIGLTGFGGPPAHVALLRELMVQRHHWMDAREFEDANAACGLLPGPASTQLAIFCARRVAGPRGALVGGLGFIAPAVVIILVLSAIFLSGSPPRWLQAVGAGAGAAVAAVAVHAARGLIGPSFARVGEHRQLVARWGAYVLLGAAGAALLGGLLVLVLLGCGALELGFRRGSGTTQRGLQSVSPGLLAGLIRGSVAYGGFGALAWTAFKVGALSYGGGFVIIPLMQGDAVHTYHWMTNSQFLTAVALGQVTPGPVVATVAAVGYAAHGLAGGLLGALVAFAPSFAFILFGGGRFDRLRENQSARAFLDGAGPAAIGAILGAAVLLAGDLREVWQFAVLAAALGALLLARRGVVETLLGAGVAGLIVVVVAGGPLP